MGAASEAAFHTDSCSANTTLLGVGVKVMARDFAPEVHSLYSRQEILSMANTDVLRDEDPQAKHFALMEICVSAGVLTACDWLASGKLCTKDDVIARSMFEAAPYLSVAPLAGSVILDLVKRGFDWFVAFDVGNAASVAANQPQPQGFV